VHSAQRGCPVLSRRGGHRAACPNMGVAGEPAGAGAQAGGRRGERAQLGQPRADQQVRAVRVVRAVQPRGARAHRRQAGAERLAGRAGLQQALRVAQHAVQALCRRRGRRRRPRRRPAPAHRTCCMPAAGGGSRGAARPRLRRADQCGQHSAPAHQRIRAVRPISVPRCAPGVCDAPERRRPRWRCPGLRRLAARLGSPIAPRAEAAAESRSGGSAPGRRGLLQHGGHGGAPRGGRLRHVRRGRGQRRQLGVGAGPRGQQPPEAQHAAGPDRSQTGWAAVGALRWRRGGARRTRGLGGRLRSRVCTAGFAPCPRLRVCMRLTYAPGEWII